MGLRNSAARYGSVAMVLHWLIALFIVINICLGLYFPDMPHSDPNRFTLAQVHESIGLTVLMLSVLRVLWRLVNPVPPLPADMNAGLKFVARATQLVLYVLIVAIPLTGWIMASASRTGTAPYFFLFHWPNLPFFNGLDMHAQHDAHERWEDIHSALAWTAIILVPLHVVGALYHAVVRRDGVFKSMLPGSP